MSVYLNNSLNNSRSLGFSNDGVEVATKTVERVSKAIKPEKTIDKLARKEKNRLCSKIARYQKSRGDRIKR